MGQLLSIGEMLVKHVYQASPHMAVMKLWLLPMSACKQVSWANSKLSARQMIVKVHGMSNNSHRPQGRVGLLRPMDSGMKHHGPGK